MKEFLARLTADDDGAVTVDFVVLTASITTLGLVAVTTFSPGTTDLANKIEAQLNNVEAK